MKTKAPRRKVNRQQWTHEGNGVYAYTLECGHVRRVEWPAFMGSFKLPKTAVCHECPEVEAKP